MFNMQARMLPSYQPLEVSHISTSDHVVVNDEPRHVTINATITRRLGEATFFIGSISITLSFVLLIFGGNGFSRYRWTAIPGFVCAIWILITGILGDKSSKAPNDLFKNWISMVFNIVSCVMCAVNVIIYLQVVRKIIGDYPHFSSDWKVIGITCTMLLLILHITVFFVALSTSIRCCAAGCCIYPGHQAQHQIREASTPPISNNLSTVQHPSTHAHSNVLFYAEEPPPTYEEEDHYFIKE